MNDNDTTLMYSEAAETPACFRQQLSVLQQPLEALSKRLREQPPKMAITCGRGSSDHAGLFARYVIETTLKIPTSSATPSILSVYGVETNRQDCLVILVSQSGQSPDLVNYAKAAQHSGAVTVGLVNQHEDAPLLQYCDYVLPLCAGAEHSVAATKSYLCTLFASLQLVAAWSDNQAMKDALIALPEQMQQAQSLDWQAGVDALEQASNMLVLGRGLGLGISNEVALKFKETCGLHAESFSAAEVIHGPLAMIKPGFLVLVFDQGDETRDSIHAAISRLLQAEATILLVSSEPVAGCIHLPVLSGLSASSTLLTFVQTSYFMIEKLSHRRGYSPDTPLHIAKVTKTR